MTAFGASTQNKNGVLYIVATPIGNRQDFSERAIQTLLSVDRILVEDTRHSGPFLTTLGIHKPLIALHLHNEENITPSLIQLLQSGESLALISDAGTPLMSDPGFALVKAARVAGLIITPIPGPCAFITALSAAGVPCDQFTFIGFLPAKTNSRKEKLRLLTQSTYHTLVAYESPHRMINSLKDIEQVLGTDYNLTLAKELTKSHERFISGTAFELTQWLLSDPGHLKGEFIIIFPPRQEPTTAQTDHILDQDKLLMILLNQLPLAQAVKIASKIIDVPKNQLYTKALTLDKQKK